MEKIEYLSDKNEIINAVKQNAKEFDLKKMYSSENDFEEAIAIITGKQIIFQPVYISHPMVALNIIESVVDDFKFERSPMTMHSELMKAYEKFKIALAYMEKEHTINILIPTKITKEVAENIISFIEIIKSQTYADTLIINSGEVYGVRINDKKIIEDIKSRQIEIEYEEEKYC